MSPRASSGTHIRHFFENLVSDYAIFAIVFRACRVMLMSELSKEQANAIGGRSLRRADRSPMLENRACCSSVTEHEFQRQFPMNAV